VSSKPPRKPEPKKAGVEDNLAEKESTAVANGDYERATQADDYRSSRRFKHHADTAFLVVFWLLILGWCSGAALSALTFAAPRAWTAFLSDEQTRLLLTFEGSTFFSSFGTKFFAKKMGIK
jgi:hypothetical protein